MMVHLEVICSLTILTFLLAFATFFFAQVSVFALTGLDLDLFVPKRLFTKKILEVCLDTIFTQKYFGKSSILHEESTILILQLFIKLLVTSTLQASVAI